MRVLKFLSCCANLTDIYLGFFLTVILYCCSLTMRWFTFYEGMQVIKPWNEFSTFVKPHNYIYISGFRSMIIAIFNGKLALNYKPNYTRKKNTNICLRNHGKCIFHLISTLITFVYFDINAKVAKIASNFEEVDKVLIWIRFSGHKRTLVRMPVSRKRKARI